MKLNVRDDWSDSEGRNGADVLFRWQHGGNLSVSVSTADDWVSFLPYIEGYTYSTFCILRVMLIEDTVFNVAGHESIVDCGFVHRLCGATAASRHAFASPRSPSLRQRQSLELSTSPETGAVFSGSHAIHSDVNQ